MKAYKSSVDAEGQTGQGAASSPFYSEMNEIFGNTVIGSAQHTIAVGSTEILVHTPSPPTPPTPPTPSRNLSKKFKKDFGISKRQLFKLKEESKESRLNEKKKILLELEEKNQKRHDEKMTLENRKLALLEKFLSTQNLN